MFLSHPFNLFIFLVWRDNCTLTTWLYKHCITLTYLHRLCALTETHFSSFHALFSCSCSHKKRSRLWQRFSFSEVANEICASGHVCREAWQAWPRTAEDLTVCHSRQGVSKDLRTRTRSRSLRSSEVTGSKSNDWSKMEKTETPLSTRLQCECKSTLADEMEQMAETNSRGGLFFGWSDGRGVSSHEGNKMNLLTDSFPCQSHVLWTRCEWQLELVRCIWRSFLCSGDWKHPPLSSDSI